MRDEGSGHRETAAPCHRPAIAEAEDCQCVALRPPRQQFQAGTCPPQILRQWSACSYRPDSGLRADRTLDGGTIPRGENALVADALQRAVDLHTADGVAVETARREQCRPAHPGRPERLISRQAGAIGEAHVALVEVERANAVPYFDVVRGQRTCRHALHPLRRVCERCCFGADQDDPGTAAQPDCEGDGKLHATRPAPDHGKAAARLDPAFECRQTRQKPPDRLDRRAARASLGLPADIE